MGSDRTYRRMRVAAVALSVLLTAAAAFADSVRVVVDRSTVWRNPTGTAGVLEIVKAGTILEVRGRQGRWLIVEASTDARQIGYILATQTEPVTPNPNAAQPPRQEPRPASPPPQARTSPPTGQSAPAQTRTSATPPKRLAAKPRPFVYGGILFQASSLDFEASQTQTTLLEPETRSTQYRMSRIPGFEVGGGAGIARRFTLGGLFVMRSSSDTAAVSAQIPHPIFYRTPRTLEGSFDSTRTEMAAHAQIGFTLYRSPRFGLVAAGGPSFFWVTQDLLDQLSYTEAYPYDTVTFTGATTKTGTAHTVGGSAQLDALVSLSRRLSWQTSGRWSFGSVEFEGTTGKAKVGQRGHRGVVQMSPECPQKIHRVVPLPPHRSVRVGC